MLFWEINCCKLWDRCETHKYTVSELRLSTEQRVFFMWRCLVPILTTIKTYSHISVGLTTIRFHNRQLKSTRHLTWSIDKCSNGIRSNFVNFRFKRVIHECIRGICSLNSMVWVRERTIPTEQPLLSAKWLPTFADRGCNVVSVTDPYGRILGYLDRSRYFSIK
jgi:hypothetical protein